VTQQPNTSNIFINRLARDPAWSVRASAARNIKISTGVLNKLARDEDQAVRFYVANNPRTPGETLAKMAKVEHRDGVRLEITRNISTPIKTLIKLLDDPYIEVRISAGNNPVLQPAMQLYKTEEGYAGLSLAEFLEMITSKGF